MIAIIIACGIIGSVIALDGQNDLFDMKYASVGFAIGAMIGAGVVTMT